MERAKAALAAAALAAALAGCFPPALTEAEMTDTGIRTRLEQAFKSHRDLDVHMVTIDVHNHIVNLTGMVSTWDDKRLIERIVAATAGIDQAFVNVIVPE